MSHIFTKSCRPISQKFDIRTFISNLRFWLNIWFIYSFLTIASKIKMNGFVRQFQLVHKYIVCYQICNLFSTAPLLDGLITVVLEFAPCRYELILFVIISRLGMTVEQNQYISIITHLLHPEACLMNRN